MTVRVSVIVPTLGRDTLGRTLRSCEGADEVLVDYNQDDDKGYAARNRMIARATGTHLSFMDDDDVFVPGAIDLIREKAHPERPTVFQMMLNGGQVIWHQPSFRYGNIGTPMLCIPNDPGRLGVWRGHDGSDSGGDFEFAAQCVSRMGDPVWVERLVARIRPD